MYQSVYCLKEQINLRFHRLNIVNVNNRKHDKTHYSITLFKMQSEYSMKCIKHQKNLQNLKPF